MPVDPNIIIDIPQINKLGILQKVVPGMEVIQLSPKYDPDNFISPGTANRCFGIEPDELKQAVSLGNIPGVVANNRVRVRETDLIEAIASGRMEQSTWFLGMYKGKLKEVCPGVFRTVV
ncbi:hypothetical protein [Heliophilum fasciatum]|uniref:Uncharacterized protein n=1 Tax=Heliophilum fasciatum TaxID=35700 RepID=A0A4R2RFD3_9FIRM|nr:hypothetical protein [Heliophilum fasciatum]MCW2279150.1 hypothetical protein [Heliophilum fasciatum]TCP61009.1 hypothetical protein EDD73_1311 [Heliophilum fasciatum]